MKTWIEGENGNRASVERWGSEEGARQALASLTGCRNCTDCTGCIDCIGCWECSDCSRCSMCQSCTWCHSCFGRSGLSDSDMPLSIPIVKNLHRAIYAVASASAEPLDECGNVNCRARWAVILAGEKGWGLEKLVGLQAAAMMIYNASCPGYEISPVRFYDTNEAALADMKRLAEMEAAHD